MNRSDAHPILSLEAAKRFEDLLFAGDEDQEWAAMRLAGRSVALSIVQDFREIASLPAQAKIVVLVGKGHNGGDALLAAQTVLELYPAVSAQIFLVFGERTLRPLAARAYRELVQSFPDRVSLAGVETLWEDADLLVDGVFGFRFRPPLAPAVAGLFDQINRRAFRLRAAVDLPSGLGTEQALRADFTYATGSVKSPLLALSQRAVVGRIRYLDLGFWRQPWLENSDERVLTEAILDSLRGLRPAASDKRSYGHLFVVGGSRTYPGAVLMSVMAALRSGVGLVTAFVPESLVAAYAAHVPEAMWVGWPETPGGNLALEGVHLLRERVARASAVLIGPGLGREEETLLLAKEVVTDASVPLVIDADALQPEIVSAGRVGRVLTPHAGEFERIAGGRDLRSYSTDPRFVTVQKGSPTRIGAQGRLVYSFFGGPVLARGGSGDLLAGLAGGLLARSPGDLWGAACRGTVWHGMAADCLARARGQEAVRTTDLLDHLSEALRGDCR